MPLRWAALLLMSLAAGTACAVAVSACGDGDGGATIAVEEADEIEVRMTEFDVEADPDRVPEGVIEFIAHNDGDRDHVLAVESSEGEVRKTRRLEPGQSSAIKVDFRPGTYEVYDPLEDYRARGMVTRIRVTPRTQTVTATDGETETQTKPRIVTVTETRDRTVIRTVTKTETVTVTVPSRP
jgi:uncharacterized cupredoxin-like copper-binding protein